MCIWDLQCFQSFRNGCLFCTYWLIRNLNCAHSHHASYGERCSNHHFRHCAQCVNEIYSVFKVFEIAVCFPHFGLFEISTPVMSNMLTIANIVWMIITNIAHTVHMTFTVFSKFSKIAVCFAHFGIFEIWTALILTILAMVNVVQFIISNIAHSVYLRLTVFWNFSKLLFVLHILAYSKFLLRWGASC